MTTLGGVLALLQFLFVNVHLLWIKTTACNVSAEPSQLHTGYKVFGPKAAKHFSV